MRPSRETYVRTSRHCARVNVTVEPGVEFRSGDDFDFMTGLLHDICFKAEELGELLTPMELAERAGALIIKAWPDRAYFVEAHDLKGWIQIFQPYGIPRNQ